MRIKFPVEALIWFISLIALAIYNPYHDSHISICPFNRIGIDFCPGCGLGRSISFLFRGDLEHSFQAHPLGAFAVIILSYRIVQLTLNYINSHGKSY